MLYDNNSSNFTLIIDLEDFDLHVAKTFNGKAMDEEEDAHGIDAFIDYNEVQYNDTL